MEIEIYSTTREDASLLSKIGAQFFYDAYKDLKFDGDLKEYIKTAFIEEEIANQISTGIAIYLIAKIKDEHVGYVKLRWDRSHPNLTTEKNLEVERIYVDRNHWRSGIGKQLMNACIEYGKQNLFTTLWLGVWQLNKRAVDFYIHSGFKIFGEKKFWVGSEENDDYVLRKSLTE